MMNEKWMAKWTMATVVLLLAVGCVARLDVGPIETKTEIVELGDADSADVDVEMGVGKLDVRGGATELLDAEFTYNVAAWEPEVEYDIRGGRGELTVKQPEAEVQTIGIPDDNIEYEWDLELNDDVPMNLTVDLGVGDSYLELSGLSLTSLDLNVGVGQTTIDLTGDWEQSFDVSIEGGVGNTAVRVPDGVGVRVETHTGVGAINVYGLIRNGDTYTNAAYETADVILDITVNGGVGEIELRLEE
ncbi:MAG: hypothetical protein GY803_04190 [Chloroflexi bacterium]|nr:hypothetical protein [Chloroflexota bacterium]